MVLSAAPVPPIDAHSVLILLLQIGLMLGLAVMLGRLARRLGMPAIVGELCAGVLLGPSILAHVAPGFSNWLLPRDAAHMHLLDAIGQIGVLLLVGITGTNIDLGLMRRRGATAAWVSAGGLIVPLAFGVGAGFLLPKVMVAEGTDRAVFAWFVGVAMCVSAIPVIAKTLLEMRLLHRNIGQLIMTAAAVDDVVGWFLLSIVSAMATGGVRAGKVGTSIAYLVLVVVFSVLIGRRIVGTVLKASAKSREPGVTVAAVVSMMMLAAAATQAMGMEAILGTFVAGILIGSSKWIDRERLAPLRTFVMSVLAPVFFATAGLRMDLTALKRPVVLGTALVVLAIAILGKFVGVYLGARTGKLGHWESLALGSGLNARGVIEVIIAMVGLRLGVLTTEMYTIVVLVAIVTSLMAPPMLRYAVRHIDVTREEVDREKALALDKEHEPVAANAH